MKQLTAKDILKANDLKRERVEVPEWGGFLYVSTLSGEARDAYESSVVSFSGGEAKQDLANIRAKFVAATVTDEDGNLLFTSEQVKELGKKSASVLDRLFDKAQKLNAISDADIEELAKN